MYVIKRDGIKESVQFDKITRRIHNLTKDIESIDPIIITQKICSRIYPGITTTELDILASDICMGMVTDNPEYSVVASRIVVSNHQKNTKENFLEVVKTLENNIDINGIKSPLVSDDLLRVATKYESQIQNMIDMERDYLLDFFGFKTLERSYLLKINTPNGKKIIERPQHLFMRVAIGIHGEDLENVEKTYNCLSLKEYTHATPTLFNAGGPRNQLASCFLSAIDDSIEGIFETYKDCGLISKWAGGIGVHISNIRSKGSYIRKTGGLSDGLIPLLKTFNSIARQFNQGGKRLGSFAMYLEPWHADIFDFLNAKRNQGAEDERARDLFYALWIPDLFMEKVQKNDDWYLMCPDKCPGLNECYGDDFVSLYNKYVSENKYNKKIKARDVWESIITSQIETGTPYMLYKDAANHKSNQKNIGTIKSSNLCAEVVEVSNKDETSVCNLASICLPSILETPNKNYDKWFNLIENDYKQITKYYFSNESRLKLFSSYDCTYCKLLKKLLKDLNINFDEIDNIQAEEYRQKAIEKGNKKELSKLSKPFETVPQLFSVLNDDIKYLGGYTDNWNVLKPRINYNKLKQLSYDLTINLNKIIDINYYPIEKTRVSNLRHRPIGIGVQGLADLFMLLKLPFDSDSSMIINKHIFETMYYGAMTASLDLAKIHGPYSTFNGSPLSEGKFQFDLWGINYDDLSGMWNWESLRTDVMKFGVMNSLLIALMPTASTSQIMKNNECFEPYTSNIYTRRTLAGEFTVVNQHLVNDLVSLDLWNEDTKDRIIYDRGSVQNLKDFPSFLKEIYKTVWEISQKNLIMMSAQRGPFVCQSQSLNLWFEKPDFNKLLNAHFTGWKLGLKTGSYYIRTKPALSSQRFGLDIEKEKKFEKEKSNQTTDEEGCLNCSA
jgi:ribonucleoside-diphosphate reductase alpha subunit